VSAEPNAIEAMLDVWRERGLDRIDPVRFHRIDALHRRAAAHDGEVRQLLDARLAALIEAHADDLNKLADAQARGLEAANQPERCGVGELAEYIAQHAARGEVEAVADEAPAGASFPELGVLEDFKQIWSKVRVESQLRETLQPAPVDAGPLNSGRLVHRSLTLMRELSPGYLQQFLSYVDALTWMQRMNGDAVMEFDETPRPGGAAKRTREKPRKRRE